jgi:hypothetical protein
MNIQINKEFSYTVTNMNFGNIPQAELIEELSSGRICGVLLERDLAYRFDNLSKQGCGQGSGADLVLNVNGVLQTVQCKTVQPSKALKGRGKNKAVDPSAAIGWTTKSGLWDSKRGKKRNVAEWDAEHEAYMQKYDYFCYINIEAFPQVSVVLVPAAQLKNRAEAKTQGAEYHFGKRSKSAPAYAAPDWAFPVSITRGMWDEFRGTEVIDATAAISTDSN